jgi:hypothetical protein
MPVTGGSPAGPKTIKTTARNLFRDVTTQSWIARRFVPERGF